MTCETATVPAPDTGNGEQPPGDGEPPSDGDGIITARNVAIGVGALGLGAVALSQMDENN